MEGISESYDSDGLPEVLTEEVRQMWLTRATNGSPQQKSQAERVLSEDDRIRRLREQLERDKR